MVIKVIKRARLIYNPSSGREEIKKRLADILQRLEQGGIETSCHATTGENDAKLAAMEAIERKFDMIIAAGGDGTLNEVINGMANQSYRPPLGIIPAGTTNDFARALGIPRQWEAACDIIIGQHVQAIDIGQANEQYFINIAGGGSITELTYEVPSKLKTMLGQLAYYMKGLEKLPYIRPISLKVMSEAQQFSGQAMIFLVANSNSVAGFEKLAPEASISDGLFDVFILKKCNLADLVRVVTAASRGELVHDPHIIYFKASQLTITSDDYVQMNLDGEFGGTLPCEISILPSHIHIYTDGTGHSTYHSKMEQHDDK